MDYKLYCLDAWEHIVSTREVAAPDDLAALQEAEKDCAEYAVEVWQGARRVARVKPGNAPLDARDRMCL